MDAIIDVVAWFERVRGYIPAMMAGDYAKARKAESGSPLTACLESLLEHNSALWGYEDQVRRPDIPDSEVALNKRHIDRENQLRNDCIDDADAALVALLERNGAQSASLPLLTETPGSAFDRLSIIALRLHHLGLECARKDATAEHKQRCSAKMAHVEERSRDLCASLTCYLADVAAGKLRVKSYRQHKLYNDPETNPAVRAARASGAGQGGR